MQLVRGTPRSKIKLIRQSEVAECGLACFVMVANHHHRTVGLAAARRVVSSLARGASLKTLSALADHFGFAGRGIEVAAEDLASVALPVILHWDHNHFVVLEAVRSGRGLVHDPNGTSKWMDLGDVARHFTGFAFEMKPVREPDEPVRTSRQGLRYLVSHVGGLSPKILQVLALTLFLQVAALATPYFAQLALDKALPERNEAFLAVLSIAFIAFILLNGAVNLLRLSVISFIGASIGEGMASGVTHRLFRLPIEWFRKRESGDVIAKFQSIFPITQVLSEDLPALLINVALAALTLVMMVIYSPVLSLIGVGTVVAYAVVRSILLPRQKSALSEMAQAHGKEQAFLFSSLYCMRSLRLSCRESVRHEHWRSRFSRFIRAEVRYKRLTNWQNAFQTTLLASANIIVIWIAVTLAMKGQFTPGMIFAFLSYSLQFMTAGIEVIDKYSGFRELDSHLENLGDIIETDDDPAFAAESRSPPILKGMIELRHVAYRYGPDAPNVLKDINLVVQAGESVAIAGPSGGGKSTLAQILLGLHRPTSGSLLVDGMELEEFGYRNYFRQVAAVLQDEGLFAGTVLENITLFSERADMELVEACARAAAIDEEIDSWPLGYRTLVGEMGIAVSSGQRQRILLARALYRQPRILVLDEGTAHLDSRCERRVNEAVRKLGITRIIFAHRRETIASADRILTLDGGKVSDPEGPNLEASYG
ncbi:MAG TPA: peptidase domain-containing ABC transporter [Allosphingosinicella sp.]